jgi:hypothetical protein
MATVTNSFHQYSTAITGPLGWVIGRVENTRGDELVWCDTYGLYRNIAAQTKWTLLTTKSRRPVTTDPDHHGGGGCWAAAFGTNDPNVIYAYDAGALVRSADFGETFIAQNGAVPVTYGDSNSQGAHERFITNKLVVDPANANVAYLSTLGTGGMWQTQNGLDWAVNSALPAPLGVSTYMASPILIDPASATLTGPTRKAIVYRYVFGRGLYKSTDGAATFNLIAGGPTGEVTCIKMGAPGIVWISEFGIPFPQNAPRITGTTAPTVGQGVNGDVYLLRNAAGALLLWYQKAAGVWGSGNIPCRLWKLTAATSTYEVAFTGTVMEVRDFLHIAINPFNTSVMMLVTLGGETSFSSDSGATWSDHDWGRTKTWIDTANPSVAAQASLSNYVAVGQWDFSAVTDGKMTLTMGIGAWTCTVTPANYTPGFTFTGMNSGIEQLVSTSVTCAPTGRTWYACHDRSLIEITNPDAAPGDVALLNYGDAIRHAQTVESLESNPTIMSAAVDYFNKPSTGGAGSRYSLNSGTTWQAFSSYPTSAAVNPWTLGSPGDGGGNLIPLSADHYIWIPTRTDINRPMRTANRGVSWQEVILPGVPFTSSPGNGDSMNNLFTNYYLRRRVIAVDPLIAGKAWIYHPGLTVGGFFETTNYGATFTLVSAAYVIPQGFYNFRMIATPDRSGHLFATAGEQSGIGASGEFKFSTDAARTWTVVPDVAEVLCMSFGKKAPGQSYPTLWIVGFVDNGTGLKYGVYYTSNPTAGAATTWTRVNSSAVIDKVDAIVDISASRTKFGEHYIAFPGSGCAWSQGAAEGKKRMRLVA